jgi:hypothetical protein
MTVLSAAPQPPASALLNAVAGGGGKSRLTQALYSLVTYAVVAHLVFALLRPIGPPDGVVLREASGPSSDASLFRAMSGEHGIVGLCLSWAAVSMGFAPVSVRSRVNTDLSIARLAL